MIIGGNEDKTGERVILKRVVELTQQSSRTPAIGVVTTASRQGESAYQRYHRIFADLGVDQVLDFTLESRKEAEASAMVERMVGTATLFFSGGDQLRITSVLGGTAFHQALLQEHKRGLNIAGTSAGASMMSDTMIVTGDAEEAPTKNTVHMAPGMGLWVGAVIDQHFSQRGRIGRLLSALAQNPGILGVGLDEDTAIEVRLDQGIVDVWGSRTVTLLDGRQVACTNASESSADRPLAITGVTLHVLPQGYGFDLNTRRPYQRQRED
ncbi:cyanophycinase [Sulfobacillus harzensis]|uniref:cyanophycinase n=1 Tax=Sulfobacillus harzensis TaxID=2729629 RepID=UPI001A9A7931|nr:cyanophycinase [Sulfobacillus harzensis]